MALYQVTLKASTPSGPLKIQTFGVYYLEGGEATLIAVGELAQRNGWSIDTKRITTQLPETIVQAFAERVEADKVEYGP